MTSGHGPLIDIITTLSTKSVASRKGVSDEQQ